MKRLFLSICSIILVFSAIASADSIVLYSEGTEHILDSGDVERPRLNNHSEVVWSKRLESSIYGIYSSIEGLVSDLGKVRDPDINDEGEIIWRFGDGGQGANGIESSERGIIFTSSGQDPYYDTQRINNNGEIIAGRNGGSQTWSNTRGNLPTYGWSDREMEVNDQGEVVSRGYMGPTGNTYDIYSTTRGAITNDDIWQDGPDINNLGEIVWQQNGEIWSNLRGRIDYGIDPSINDLGEIVWTDDGYVYSNMRGQITSGNVNDRYPQINNLGDIVFLRSDRETVPEGVVILFTVPREIEVWVYASKDMVPQTEFQLGELIEFMLEGWELRGGDFPRIADDVTFTLSNEEDEVIWTRSVGPVGGGWASRPGGGWGIGFGWEQIDIMGNRVPAGQYKLGVSLTNPTYPVQEDYPEALHITISDGAWMFRHSQEELGGGAIAMAAGDIDNDGFADLIFHGENNSIYLNNGDGTFNFAYAFSDSSDFHGRCIRLGDLNGDGFLDLVEGIYGYPRAYPNTEIRIYLNDGTGLFDQPSSIPLSRLPTSYWDNSQFVALGDIDKDNDIDIVISFSDQSKVEIYLNDGKGNFSVSQQEIPSQNVHSPILGDLDGDGDMDLITANSENQPNNVWLNDGNGTFTKSDQDLGSSYTYAGAVGDIDNDGDLDFVAGNIAAPQEIYLNNGQGIFSFWYSFQETERSYSHPVLLEDLDNDGDLDMITGGDRTYVYENDGTGVFTASSDSLEGTSGLNGDAILIDVDNDSDLDLVTTGWKNKLYYNNTPVIPVIIPPKPIITINGQSEDNIFPGRLAIISLGLDSNSYEAEPADYFLWVETPSGIIHCKTADGWVKVKDLSEITPLAQTNLTTVEEHSFMKWRYPLIGTTTFHYAVDLDQDGQLNTPYYEDTAEIKFHPISRIIEWIQKIHDLFCS